MHRRPDAGFGGTAEAFGHAGRPAPNLRAVKDDILVSGSLRQRSAAITPTE